MQARWSSGLLLAFFASTLMSCGTDQTDSDSADNGINAWLEREYHENQKRYATDPDIRVERGLLANKKHRYIDLLATATGAGPDTSLDAFVATTGGDSTRAIAETTVKPGSVQAALEFIGMSAGHPLDARNAHHWPKGERVSITFYWDDLETGLLDQSVRAEELMTDTRLHTQLPALGFRFVGSSGRAVEEIATGFNATNTVLEVPYIINRRSVQGLLVASEDHYFSAGQKLRLRIRPEFRDDRRRVRDFMLDIQAGAGTNAEQLQNLRITLSEAEGGLLVDGDFEAVFVYLKALIDDGQEPFLQLRFSDSLAVGSVRTIAKFVQTFLIAQDVRFDPSEEHLFYRAFLPSDAWRDPQRRGRASQPLEIHLAGSVSDGLSGEIIQYSQSPATIAPKTLVFHNEEKLRQALQEGTPWNTDGVFLFVDPASPYAKIRQVHQLVQTLFPNIYVFM